MTSRVSIAPLSAGLAAVLLLSACAGPFVDRRREAGTLTTAGESTLDRPVVCYSALDTTPEEIRALARQECAKTGRAARFVDQRYYQCALSAPHQAVFACVGAPTRRPPLSEPYDPALDPGRDPSPLRGS